MCGFGALAADAWNKDATVELSRGFRLVGRCRVGWFCGCRWLGWFRGRAPTGGRRDRRVDGFNVRALQKTQRRIVVIVGEDCAQVWIAQTTDQNLAQHAAIV